MKGVGVRGGWDPSLNGNVTCSCMCACCGGSCPSRPLPKQPLGDVHIPMPQEKTAGFVHAYSLPAVNSPTAAIAPLTECCASGAAAAAVAPVLSVASWALASCSATPSRSVLSSRSMSCRWHTDWAHLSWRVREAEEGLAGQIFCWQRKKSGFVHLHRHPAAPFPP